MRLRQMVSEPDSCLYISGEGGIRDKEHSDTLHQLGIRTKEDIVPKTLWWLFAGRQQSRRQSGGLWMKLKHSGCRSEQKIFQEGRQGQQHGY
jgi:hypothetical protein